MAQAADDYTAPTRFLQALARVHLSLMIKDPFVRAAFERAERDGLAPLAVEPADVPPTLKGGAAAALEPVEA